MDQKHIESRHFKLFRTLMSDFPEGEVRHEDQPDFRVHTMNGCLGVEHRQLFHPKKQDAPLLQALENHIDEILTIAQEHAELRGMPPVYAAFYFNHHLLGRGLTKQKRRDLGRKIARAAYKNLPEVNEHKEFEFGQIHDVGLPEEVEWLFLSRTADRKRHDWGSLEQDEGEILTDCRQALQKAINEKSEKLNSYRQHCRQCWLLVVADGLKPSSYIHPYEVSKDHIYESPFDRTYFLDCGKSDLIRLKTSTGNETF